MTDVSILDEMISETRTDIAKVRSRGDTEGLDVRALCELRASLSRLVKTRAEVEYQMLLVADLTRRIAGAADG